MEFFCISDNSHIKLQQLHAKIYLNKFKDKDGSGMVEKNAIAIVCCETVSEVCPGGGCLAAFSQRKACFADYDANTFLAGFFTCGGCPGRRVPRLVEKLRKYGLKAVHLSSCIKTKNSATPKCPFWESIKKSIESKGIEVIEGSH
jgi:predicted metal-binding protein